MKTLLGLIALAFARGHHADRAPLRHRYAGWVFRTLPGQITCQQFEDFLMDYREGDLPAAQTALFERHLSLCPQCRASYLGYVRSIELGQKLFAQAQGPLPEEVPDHIVAAVVSALDAR
ncbi:anti-sigma factor family protein [Minwuia sp.]|uniref:anti-sigma factor family protein n=1 Tax=Minwuia sp. TaxID=2493630 RepID=UPI003A91BB3A